MIELITGKPGSGKTYLAVQRLLDLEVGKYVVYTNIAGLDASAFREPEMVRKIPEDFREWATKSAQIEWSDAVKEKFGRPMLIVIDEAQMEFASRNPELLGWLSWHRHLGQDIWLICQHSKMLHSDYVNLAEYEVRSVKSQVLNMLVYQYRMGGETFKTIRRRRDPKVFRCYRSFDQSEASKVGFRLLWWAAGLMVVAIGGFCLVQYGFFSKGGPPVGGSAVAPARVKVAPVSSVGSRDGDVWERVSYAGVLGDSVLVQVVGDGRVCDLGQVVREKYGVIEAGSRSCTVVTKHGKRVVRRVPLEIPGDEAGEMRRTAPKNAAEKKRAQ